MKFTIVEPRIHTVSQQEPGDSSSDRLVNVTMANEDSWHCDEQLQVGVNDNLRWQAKAAVAAC